MKVRILSDLHLEWADWIPPKVDCDLVILAGDIHKRGEAFPWIDRHFKGTPAIYICGNHEFYKQSLPATIHEHQELAKKYPNIYFLNNQWTTVNSMPIYGGTMWTDYNLYGDRELAMRHALLSMNDYRLIRDGGGNKISPEYLERCNALWHTGFSGEGAPPTLLLPYIVVSHHAPSERSIHHTYAGNAVNPCYASNMEQFIHNFQPSLWVHGHTHRSCHYMIGKTHVICNPKGYPTTWDANPDFDPTLVVEV